MANKYIVLSEKQKSEPITDHAEAMLVCDSYKSELCKGVYLMLDSKTLGPLNIYGGQASQIMMQQIYHNEFTFKVI